VTEGEPPTESKIEIREGSSGMGGGEKLLSCNKGRERVEREKQTTQRLRMEGCSGIEPSIFGIGLGITISADKIHLGEGL